MEKKTPEEFAEKFTPKSDKWTIKEIFIEGAKWQQEKIIKELESRKSKEMNSFFREFYTSTIKLIKQ
jgi:hypothetical protein